MRSGHPQVAPVPTATQRAPERVLSTRVDNTPEDSAGTFIQAVLRITHFNLGALPLETASRESRQLVQDCRPLLFIAAELFVQMQSESSREGPITEILTRQTMKT